MFAQLWSIPLSYERELFQTPVYRYCQPLHGRVYNLTYTDSFATIVKFQLTEHFHPGLYFHKFGLFYICSTRSNFILPFILIFSLCLLGWVYKWHIQTVFELLKFRPLTESQTVICCHNFCPSYIIITIAILYSSLWQLFNSLRLDGCARHKPTASFKKKVIKRENFQVIDFWGRFDVICQTQGGVFHQISKHWEVGRKKEAQPSFF